MEEKKTVRKNTKKKTESVNNEVQNQGGFTQEQMMQMQQMMGMMFQTFVQNMNQVQTSQVKEETKVESEVKKTIKKGEKVTKAMLAEIQDEKIIVTSLDAGVVFISPRTQITYRWSKKGDTEVMSIEEILTMEKSSQKFLHNLWLKIDDIRVIQALKLEEIYNYVDMVEDLEGLSSMNYKEIEYIFSKLPKGYKSLFRDNIYSQVKSGEIRDIMLINALGDILDTDFKNL